MTTKVWLAKALDGTTGPFGATPGEAARLFAAKHPTTRKVSLYCGEEQGDLLIHGFQDSRYVKLTLKAACALD